VREIVLIILLVTLAPAAAAQETLDLAAIQQRAIDADPRIRQLQLEAMQTELRLRNIEAERKPSVSLEGQAQVQSEVIELPFPQTGTTSLRPPKDTYEAAVRIERMLLDPTTRARIAAEEARLAEAQARVRTALFTLRQEVNEAFFAAALLQEREAQIATAITDLEARLRDATLRVEAGTALPSDAASIEAALLQRRQDAAELRASRRAALARLSRLTDSDYSAEQALAVPRLGEPLAEARANLDVLRARPEFEQFALTRERLEAQKELVDTQTRPRVSAYGKAAYGRPGLDPLESDLHPYWLAGVRVQWKPWTWGTTARERELLELQQEAITSEEEAFARTLLRNLENDLAAIDHLRDVAATDDRIVALREEIERETRIRYGEQVVTAAEYVDRQTDVLEARLLRASHRVQLAQAEARVLTLLGVEVR
jgi:outer membrane protein TolC